jgi:hypothetical protein
VAVTGRLAAGARARRTCRFSGRCPGIANGLAQESTVGREVRKIADLLGRFGPGSGDALALALRPLAPCRKASGMNRRGPHLEIESRYRQGEPASLVGATIVAVEPLVGARTVWPALIARTSGGRLVRVIASGDPGANGPGAPVAESRPTEGSEGRRR